MLSLSTQFSFSPSLRPDNPTHDPKCHFNPTHLHISTKDPVFTPQQNEFNSAGKNNSGAGDSPEKGIISIPAGIRRELMPEHVAVIMDGNRRWARMRGLPSGSGYEAGIRAFRVLVELCCKWGIRVLTVFAFSSDNWVRPKMEVDFLMNLFEKGIKAELDNFMRASDYPKEYDGACLQMRLSYCSCAHIFLCLVQWSDCHLAGALGLLRILIYKAYEGGKTSMYVHERKASIREFYGVIFPSLQLQRGIISDTEDRKQKELCATTYRRREEMDGDKLNEVEIEREEEEECGICMEMNSKIVLPSCNHNLCMKCYRNWLSRSKTCPFCRDSLKRVNSADLWIYTSTADILDLNFIARESLKRLVTYIKKLPMVAVPAMVSYNSHS